MTTASGWHSEPDRPVQLVTTARESGREEQDGRVRRYLITMGIRTTSFVLAAVTQGWLRWTFVALAVFLPYVAVVAANAVRPRALGVAITPPGAARQLSADAHEETAQPEQAMPSPSPTPSQVTGPSAVTGDDPPAQEHHG